MALHLWALLLLTAGSGAVKISIARTEAPLARMLTERSLFGPLATQAVAACRRCIRRSACPKPALEDAQAPDFSTYDAGAAGGAVIVVNTVIFVARACRAPASPSLPSLKAVACTCRNRHSRR